MKADEPVRPISTDAAEHYAWGNGCDGWHLVRETSLSVIEEIVPPGAAEVRHHHAHAQQFFYVLEGEASMHLEGQVVRFTAGQGLRIPPGVSHQFRNHSDRPVRFLVISQPPSHGDRITK